ncbi:uncharacterized protein LOC111595480 isoform X1 [Drosophila hydei]|uniref:Uncharacterized protein LOC111595480 isoform X1 n=1 Tax=Drosophila hydei TaxID=7224 RepID=A0A6J1LDH9_DROHY|nr:uncharacterized protein LOC111595480 isoform X1 [Drosophila hydei]
MADDNSTTKSVTTSNPSTKRSTIRKSDIRKTDGDKDRDKDKNKENANLQHSVHRTELQADEEMPEANNDPAKSRVTMQCETAPERKASVGRIVRKPRMRSKKPLKPSVIRRMCQIPSEEGIGADSCDAEIMYTNSQFGRAVDPCNHSSCRMCALAPRRRTKVKGMTAAAVKSKTKSKRSALSKRRTTAKMARPSKASSDRRVGVKSILNLEPVNQTPPSASKRSVHTRQCLCTELNGQVYKLMDLPSNADSSSALMLTLRHQQLKRISKPRLSTKRQVGKRPTNSRKLSKHKPN